MFQMFHNGSLYFVTFNNDDYEKKVYYAYNINLLTIKQEIMNYKERTTEKLSNEQERMSRNYQKRINGEELLGQNKQRMNKKGATRKNV